MLKIFKYMKHSALSVVCILLLLFIQAMSDLSLPDYTSDIVNVGIQQGGISETAPEAIRKSRFDWLLLFMNEEEQTAAREAYRLAERESLSGDEYDRLVKKYPALADEALYLREVNNGNDLEQLNDQFAKPILAVSALTGSGEQADTVRAQVFSQLAAAQPEGTAQEITEEQLFALLSAMPQEARDRMVDQFSDQLTDLPETMVSQGAVLYVKEEYTAIGMDTDWLQTRYILLSGAKMLLVALISMASAMAVTFLASRVAASLGRDLRRRVFGKVVSFSQAEFDHFSTSTLITRSTNDIQQIQMMMVMLLRIVFYAPIMGVGGVLKVVRTNNSMTWIIGVAVLIVMAIVVFLFCVVMPRFKIMQKLVDRINLVTREILSGLPVIRAFSTEKHEEERFDKANRDLTKTNLFVNRVMSGMMPAMMLLMNGITILIVWNGAHGIDSGAMQVGDMMAFIQYTMQIVMSFLMISMVSVMLPRASVAASRVTEVLDTPVSVTDPEKESAEAFHEDQKGVVEFRHVSFRYPGADGNALTDISFTARPGETTAFIGSTGSGKSTLLNLIPRFYDVTEGEVLVDGVDVRNVPQGELRERIGYVPQKGVLFSGTMESNIKYGCPDASQEEMERAARIAQADSFIGEKSEGYQSPISQGGDNVSGGQKQRLSIARAIAKRPEVYLFDDSFSALDFKTDAALRAALRAETADSTVLIVAQRISTILHAEQILVLDEGRVVGRGTHRELLESCEEYRQIATSQLSKEELSHE